MPGGVNVRQNLCLHRTTSVPSSPFVRRSSMLELNVQTIAFLIFAILSLGGALGVVTSRNLIHGALYLIVSLFGGAGFFVLLSAPFIAVVQVLVYIGAISILIIFAVML